jgi:hypothetical protein
LEGKVREKNSRAVVLGIWDEDTWVGQIELSPWMPCLFILGRMEHVAGKMESWVQRCTRCGLILSDYRNVGWPADQAPPTGFHEGDFVIRIGNVTTSSKTSDTGPGSKAVACTPPGKQVKG